MITVDEPLPIAQRDSLHTAPMQRVAWAEIDIKFTSLKKCLFSAEDQQPVAPSYTNASCVPACTGVLQLAALWTGNSGKVLLCMLRSLSDQAFPKPRWPELYEGGWAWDSLCSKQFVGLRSVKKARDPFCVQGRHLRAALNPTAWPVWASRGWN